MNKNVVPGLVTLAAVILSGCATDDGFTPHQPSETGNAIVYIYRPSSGLMGAGYRYQVYVEDRLIGDLGNGEYCVYEAPGGSIEIAAKFMPGALTAGPITGPMAKKEKPIVYETIELAGGQEYFVKVKPYDKKDKLHLQEAATGQKEVSKCKLDDPIEQNQ